MPISGAKWIKYLIAILLGNAIYFSIARYLPPAAQHGSSSVNLGTVVDFWICLCIYGLLELGALWFRDRAGHQDPKD